MFIGKKDLIDKLRDYVKNNDNDVIYLKIIVSSAASKNEIYEVLDGNVFKIKVTAAPRNFKANKYIEKNIKKLLKLHECKIVGGCSSKNKLLQLR